MPDLLAADPAYREKLLRLCRATDAYWRGKMELAVAEDYRREFAL